jgi:hypothetical protein
MVEVTQCEARDRVVKMITRVRAAVTDSFK